MSTISSVFRSDSTAGMKSSASQSRSSASFKPRRPGEAQNFRYGFVAFWGFNHAEYTDRYWNFHRGRCRNKRTVRAFRPRMRLEGECP